MIKNVLLVDDDQVMSQALKELLGKYQDTFAVLLAADGLEAIEHLNKNLISLVITDLIMPKMDGFELLAHILQQYPDVPVMIMTGHSTPERRHFARKRGAIGYIIKPFRIEELARQIITILSRESEGGTLQNVSSTIFLQLVEMDQKTCTIRLENNTTGEKGVLFFREGDLLDARVNTMRGESAAQKIFSWDQVDLSIQNGCAIQKKRIHSEIQYLVIEAARRKDDALSDVKHPVSELGSFISNIKARILRHLGPSCGLEDVYQDHSWDQQIMQLSEVGRFFNLGEMMSGYFDTGDLNNYILIAGEKPIVLAVNPKCQRDKIMKLLTN